MDKITHILENVVSCCRDANDSARRLVRRPKAIGESEHWRSSEQHSGNRGRLETTRQPVRMQGETQTPRVKMNRLGYRNRRRQTGQGTSKPVIDLRRRETDHLDGH